MLVLLLLLSPLLQCAEQIDELLGLGGIKKDERRKSAEEVNCKTGSPGAEPWHSIVKMPTSFAEPLLVVDMEKMHQIDTRNVETLFSMWSGKQGLFPPEYTATKRSPKSSPGAPTPWTRVAGTKTSAGGCGTARPFAQSHQHNSPGRQPT